VAFKNAARLLVLPAMRANTGDFDHRTFRDKDRGTTRRLQRISRSADWRFAHRAALLANQENLRIVAGVAVHAVYERVAAFNAMDQSVFAQKIERAINA